MELKQFFSIIWQRRGIFAFFFVAVIFLAFVWKVSQPERYEAVFPIEITRENYQQTDDYRYDQFYRLQADERYADVVVRWLQSIEFKSAVTDNLSKEKNPGLLVQKLKGERLSSNYIRAGFLTTDKHSAESVVDAIEKTLNEENEALNEKAQDPTWFYFLVGKPQVVEEKINNWIVFGFATAVGLILGILFSLFHYYIYSNEDRD